MLEALRSFVGSWVAKLLLILLVGSFALWGVSGSILGGGDVNTVAHVGETKVSVRNFVTAYNRNMGQLQQSLQRRLTRDQGRLYGVESRSLSEVVTLGTLDEYARTQRIALSEEKLAELIAQNPAFHDSTGKFNRDTFSRAVREAQLRESEFITAQNKQAIRAQLAESISTSAIMPVYFQQVLTDFTFEERKFDYIKVTADHIGVITAPTDAELKTYYEANKATYKAPEYRKLEILSIEPKDIADEKSISDEAVAKDYDERKDSYSKPEKRKVQQIVFTNQEKADAATIALAEGKSFQDILDANEIKLSDANLGWLSKSQLPKAVRDDVFALKVDTPSAVLKGAFGPTLYQVSEILAASVTPLDEVKDQIRKDLALHNAADQIISMQEAVEDSRAGGASLQQTAEKLGLKTRLIEAIDRTGQTPNEEIVKDIPASSKVLAQAFQTEVGSQASPIDFGSAGYVWYDVLAITATRDRPLEEVKEKLVQDWTTQKKRDLIKAKAEEIKTRITKGASLQAIATELSIEVQTTPFLTRNGTADGFARSAIAAGFGGDKSHVAIAPEGENQVLITVNDMKSAAQEANKIPKENLDRYNQAVANDLISQMINHLQSEYVVTQNPTLIDQVLTQN